MATHTAGEWTVSKGNGARDRTRRTISSNVFSRPGVTDGRDCIAEIFSDSEEQVEADARLMAASPDLLAALQTLERAIANNEPFTRAEHEQARAAIAKAIA